MQHTKLELTVDPEAWHVDPDGAIVVDTADMLLVFPQAHGGAARIAYLIFSECEWAAATVGHLDDAPASDAWPATTEDRILGELSEIRQALADTVADLRSVIDPERPGHTLPDGSDPFGWPPATGAA